MTSHWHETITDAMDPAHLRLMLEGAGLEIFRVTGPSAPDGRFSATVRIQDAHYNGEAIRSATGSGPTENLAIRRALEDFARSRDIVIV